MESTLAILNVTFVDLTGVLEWLTVWEVGLVVVITVTRWWSCLGVRCGRRRKVAFVG
jgi:hypothetical protein